MYIKIDNCSPDNYINDSARLEALDNLLSSHAKRTHFIYAKDDVVDKIINNPEIFGVKSRKYATDLKRYRRDIGSVKNIVEIQFIADFSQDDIDCFLVDEASSPVIVTCSFKLFLDSSFINGSVLLGENRLDCRFYSLLGHLFISNNENLANTNIVNTFKSGGGSQTHVEYTQLMNNLDFALCLLDNDKAHPAAGIGSTAAMFKSRRNEVGFHRTTESVVIDVREVESLIPMNIITNVIENDLNHQDKVEAFEKFKNLNEQDPENFRAYFDHKSGLKLKKSWSIDSKYTPFWESFFPKEFLSSSPCNTTKECINTKEVTSCDNCYQIYGFGENLLSHSLKYENNFDVNKLPEKTRSTYNLIGKKVFTWGGALGLTSIVS